MELKIIQTQEEFDKLALAHCEANNGCNTEACAQSWKAGYSKCFTWKLSNKEGVLLPEWFDMNLKDVMIKDLHF